MACQNTSDQRDPGEAGPSSTEAEETLHPMVGRGWDTHHPVSGSGQGWFIFNTGLAWIPSWGSGYISSPTSAAAHQASS